MFKILFVTLAFANEGALVVDRVMSNQGALFARLPQHEYASMRTMPIKDKLHIGSMRMIRIHAPLEKVRAVLADVPRYPLVLPNVVSVKQEVQSENAWTIAWERRAPVFFLSNIRYTIAYKRLFADAVKVLTRYSLTGTSSSVRSIEGGIMLEAHGAYTDMYCVDFFDAEWGLLGAFAPKTIWYNALQEAYVSDIAMKIAIEQQGTIASELKVHPFVEELVPLDEKSDTKVVDSQRETPEKTHIDAQ